MDLIGKYVICWLSAAEYYAMFGVRYTVTDRTNAVDFAIGGRIKAATPQLGLWIELHEAMDADDKDLDVSGERGRSRLVRWEWIWAPIVLEKEQPLVGFGKSSREARI